MTERPGALGLLGCALALAGCAADPAVPPEAPPIEAPFEARSLLGEPLRRPRLEEAFRHRQEDALAEARERLALDPTDTEARIWVARRTAYLGRFRDAIEILGDGIALHPDDPRLYRHRGHRLITLRRFDEAVADLSRAAKLIEGSEDRVEPDGLPNARNEPRSTTHFNVWYHLGLAHYLTGAYPPAEAAFRQALASARNDDTMTAASYWTYLTLRRQGTEAEAKILLRPIHEGLDIVENHAYQRVLLMFLDRRDPDEVLADVDPADGVDFATVAYGAANAHFHAGRAHRAERLLREIVDGESWTAFGYIAAEADLARMRDGGY